MASKEEDASASHTVLPFIPEGEGEQEEQDAPSATPPPPPGNDKSDGEGAGADRSDYLDKQISKSKLDMNDADDKALMDK